MFCTECGRVLPESGICICKQSNTENNTGYITNYNEEQGNAVNEAAQQETAQPEVQPQVNQPQVNQPYGGQPQMNQPYGYQPQMNQPYGMQPQYVNQPYGYQPANNPQQQKTAQIAAIIKKGCASPATLVIALLLTAGFVLNLVSIFMTLSPTGNYAYDAAMDMVAGPTMVIGIIALIPMLLMIIGAYLVYGQAKAPGNTMKTSGFTCVKAAYIMQIVFQSIGLGLIILLVLLMMVFSAAFMEGFNEGFNQGMAISGVDVDMASGMIMGVLVIVLIVCVVVVILGITVSVSMKNSVNSMKNVMVGMPFGKISMYPIVMMFIVAGLNIVSLLSSISTFAMSGSSDIMSEIYGTSVAMPDTSVLVLDIIIIALDIVVIFVGMINLIRIRSKVSEVLFR